MSRGTTRCFYFDNLGGSKRPLCPPYRRETQQGEDQTHWALQCGDSPPESHLGKYEREIK